MNRVLLALAVVLLALVLALNLESGGNYAAERTAQVQAQEAARTERTALVEGNHTERIAINAALLQWQMAQEAQTMRLMLVLVLVALVAGMATTVIVVALRRPAQPGEIPQPSATLLQMRRWYPAHILAFNDEAQEWMLVGEDGTYLLESSLQSHGTNGAKI